MSNTLIQNISNSWHRPSNIAPLITFRVFFGLLLLYGSLWSLYKDDIHIRYLSPQFYFKYYGFEWVGEAGLTSLYILYSILILASIAVIFGLIYRLSTLAIFLIFTYLQLIDSSNYINHYYLISILALFLFFVPANGAYALDNQLFSKTRRSFVPNWCILLFKIQITIVYTCAGIAKLNPDWIYQAMPLKIWLTQHNDYPILGNLFQHNWLHYAFSWTGALFDLSIAYLLWYNKTRRWAYLIAILFHLITWSLFDIGLFPPLMIGTTLIFFPPKVHQHLWKGLKYSTTTPPKTAKWITFFWILFLSIQLILPFRHHILYTGNPLWTTEGYRFAWRVMLVEKEGIALFHVKDPKNNRIWEIDNKDFLTPYQIKRMAVQPDHILQYAHYLAKLYKKRYQIEKPVVNATVYVTLNGRLSQLLIDPTVNLVTKNRSILAKSWILPLQE